MSDEAREQDWSLIEKQLPQGWRELAEEMRLVKKRPAHMGQKILDIAIALRLVLHYVSQRGSQRATIAMAAAAGLVTISQVALFKWMQKIGPYLEALVARMVEPGTYASDNWGGFVLVVGDATTAERPGATGTTARIHYALHLSDLRPRFIRITDASVGETMRNFDPEPGELWIIDRGYANPPGVEFTIDRGSALLVRYNTGTLPVFDVHGISLDFPHDASGASQGAQGIRAHPRRANAAAAAVLDTALCHRCRQGTGPCQARERQRRRDRCCRVHRRAYERLRAARRRTADRAVPRALASGTRLQTRQVDRPTRHASMRTAGNHPRMAVRKGSARTYRASVGISESRCSPLRARRHHPAANRDTGGACRRSPSSPGT